MNSLSIVVSDALTIACFAMGRPTVDNALLITICSLIHFLYASRHARKGSMRTQSLSSANLVLRVVETAIRTNAFSVLKVFFYLMASA